MECNQSPPSNLSSNHCSTVSSQIQRTLSIATDSPSIVPALPTGGYSDVGGGVVVDVLVD